ncbi:MAG: cytochrome C, partial [Pirellulales bacterium]|nr:cytochrome C [Pirellulales bacterium]
MLASHPTRPAQNAFGEAAVTQSQSSTPTHVGRQVCAECHRDNFERHAQHGHASTFFRVAETELPQIFDGQTLDGGKDYGVYSYEKDDQGNLLTKLPDGKAPESLPLQYALGSGRHAQTFLTLYAHSQGQTEGIEHRISCYSENRLSLTVGHEKKTPTNSLERFGDVLRGVPLERCIYCH